MALHNSSASPTTNRLWRAGAVIALALGAVAWVGFTWFVLVVSLWIVGFRHGDGIANGDRTFLAWAPATAFFVAPVVLTYLSVLVIRWRRPGILAVIASFALGGAISAIAAGTVLWLGWNA
jgi:hypothetical protein